MRSWFATCVVCCVLAAPVAAKEAASVYLEDLTWMEVRDRIKAGTTTVIIPTGGTEQNGPHLVIGKHNFIVQYTAGEIARKLGDALVAPVIAYVPEGRISPPEGHMRFPGTISVSEVTLAAVLEDAARSFQQNGFRLIVLIGDHGGSQGPQQQVAEKLSAEWRGQGARVINVDHYYKDNGQAEWAKARGVKAVDPAAHAGFMDTAEMLSLRPEGVRNALIAEYGPDHYLTAGVAGDPREATAAYGQKLLSLKVEAAVKQVQDAESRH